MVIPRTAMVNEVRLLSSSNAIRQSHKNTHMKNFTFTMVRTYETIVEVEATSKAEALKQLHSMDIYHIELEQCCVVEENIYDTLGNRIEY